MLTKGRSFNVFLRCGICQQSVPTDVRTRGLSAAAAEVCQEHTRGSGALSQRARGYNVRRVDRRVAASLAVCLVLAVAAARWWASQSDALDNDGAPNAAASARTVESVQTAHADVDAILRELSRIREATYAEIDVAASADTLIDFHWQATAQEMLAAFRADQGGVWCAGAAQLLHAIYRELGYESYVLHYGILGALTHAVVVVRIDGKLYIQDPYFNYHFSFPLDMIFDQLMQGRLPEIVEGAPRFRDVHRLQDDMRERWAVDPKDPEAKCLPRAGGREVCRAIHTIFRFISRYSLESDGYFIAIDRAAEFGLPRDLRALLFFPYGLFGPEGYVNDPESPLNNGVFGEIVALVRQATGGRLDPLAIPENFPR